MRDVKRGEAAGAADGCISSPGTFRKAPGSTPQPLANQLQSQYRDQVQNEGSFRYSIGSKSD
jgi:hypothetical protein